MKGRKEGRKEDEECQIKLGHGMQVESRSNGAT